MSGILIMMARLLGGMALLFVAAFMLIGFLAGGGGDHEPWGVAIALLVGIGIPGATGSVLLYRHLFPPELTQGKARVRAQTQDAEIVRLAGRKGGRLTVVEVVAEIAIAVEDAEASLGRLAERGLAEPEVTESGLIVYVFRDVEQLGEKDKSRGVLDA